MQECGATPLRRTALKRPKSLVLRAISVFASAFTLHFEAQLVTPSSLARQFLDLHQLL